jgi:uncharacterized protein YndB with AHSA1/START domain
MIVRDAVIIEAPVERVWEVFTDVDRWPEWTPSVTRAAVIAGDGVAIGARVRIKQPRLPEMTWEVTRVEPGSTWTWVSRSPGAVTEAVHTCVRSTTRRPASSRSSNRRGSSAPSSVTCCEA